MSIGLNDSEFFANNSWTYPECFSTSAQEEILDSLRKLEKPFIEGKGLASSIEHLLLHGGGKAVGLYLCEMIASTSDLLSVPPWFFVGWKNSEFSVGSINEGHGEFEISISRPSVEQYADNFIQTHNATEWWIRSSEYTEDWISPKSGTASSKLYTKRYGSSGLIPNNVVNRDLTGAHTTIKCISHPTVIQQGVVGVGLVVDVVHSEILDTTVMRVAHGRRPKNQEPTSPTWDFESEFMLVDFFTGDVLIDNHRINSEMVESLRENLAIGLLATKMACQLEIYYDDYLQDGFDLVQYRPLPEKMLCPFEITKFETPPDLITCKVNHSGKYSGDLVRISGYVQQSIQLDLEDDLPPPTEAEVQFNGKGIIWENLPDKSRPYDHLAYGDIGGAHLQICVETMICGSFHGVPMRVSDDVHENDEAAPLFERVINSKNLFIALEVDDHKQLFSNTDVKALEVVSDGVIAGIWLS